MKKQRQYNNRKTTKGRKRQIIKLSDGTTKTIIHHI